jgi:AbrB family looped-hinge helix DNA binding protein
MSEFDVTLGDKGRVTIPAEVRQRLGLRHGDRVTFVVGDDARIEVRVTDNSGVGSLVGAAGSLTEPMSWERVQEIAREDRFDAQHANADD